MLAFVSARARNDLSALLETDVQVYIEPAASVVTPTPVVPGEIYMTLEDSVPHVEMQQITFSTYSEDPTLLEIDEMEPHVETYEQRFHSALLKSNCRVTSQPDWGDIYISIKSQLPVNAVSLLKYIVSFRDECHFHEEICETVFKRLSDIFTPLELCVTCLYARRGGIDINPVRASDENLISSVLIDPTQLHAKTLKQ